MFVFFRSALYHSNINANIIQWGKTSGRASAIVGHIDFVTDFMNTVNSKGECPAGARAQESLIRVADRTVKK